MERSTDELRGTPDADPQPDRTIARRSAATGFNLPSPANRPSSARGAHDVAALGAQSPAYYAEAARLASRIGPSRRATILLVQAGAVTRVATSAGNGAAPADPDLLSNHPHVARAVTSGAIVIDGSPGRADGSKAPGGMVAAIPVRTDGNVVGVLEVEGGAEGFDEAHIEQLAALANIIGFGFDHDAMVSDLTEEAGRSRNLEKLKSEFLNIAAHELRSPLGIIRGYASLLSEVALSPEERASALERITQKSEEMAQLITDMLETARLETMGLDLSLVPVDLTGVISEAVAAMRPLLGANHRFALDATGEAIAVVADRRRLVTMLSNLIDNAIKYSPRGGEIEVRVASDGRVASVMVRDQGIGISAEQIPFLFTRFGRLVTPETSHIRGTGLGLYLARETARLHGGDIVLTSEAGRGSTFTILLPVV